MRDRKRDHVRDRERDGDRDHVREREREHVRDKERDLVKDRDLPQDSEMVVLEDDSDGLDNGPHLTVEKVLKVFKRIIFHDFFQVLGVNLQQNIELEKNQNIGDIGCFPVKI